MKLPNAFITCLSLFVLLLSNAPEALGSGRSDKGDIETDFQKNQTGVREEQHSNDPLLLFKEEAPLVKSNKK